MSWFGRKKPTEWRREEVPKVFGWWGEKPPHTVFMHLVMIDLSHDPRNKPYLKTIWRFLQTLQDGKKPRKITPDDMPLDMLHRFAASVDYVRDAYGAEDRLQRVSHAAPRGKHDKEILRAAVSEILHAEAEAVLGPLRKASGRPRKLSPKQRLTVLDLRSAGWSNAEIARTMGVSRSTISRLK